MLQTSNNSAFFNSASKFYNTMINYEVSLKNKIELFKRLQVQDQDVADLGCGTGVDSIALKYCKNRVDSFDPSSKMIEVAKKISIEKNFKINFYNFPIEKIPEKFDEKYTFICSLGNTIANISYANLEIGFSKIYNLLKSDGQVLIHILNYNLILLDKKRIINITQSDKFHFVRFYDFIEDHLVFNILKYSNSNPVEHELISKELFPHTYDKLVAVLSAFNFKNLSFYENLIFKPFDVSKSKDLFILLKK